MKKNLKTEAPAENPARKLLVSRIGAMRGLYLDSPEKPGALALASEREFDALCDIFAEHAAMLATLVEIECYLASAVEPSRANAVALAKVRRTIGAKAEGRGE